MMIMMIQFSSSLIYSLDSTTSGQLQSQRDFCTRMYLARLFKICFIQKCDRLCGLVVRVSGYRSRGPGSISHATRLSE
jgi:hypothetical protein